MNEKDIEDIVYMLKKAKENNSPKPIFFLGAGASRTGNIPLAGEIIKQILEKYCDNPSLKRLPENNQTYAELMNCLDPNERDELLKNFIDEAKINVTHIYLAQLIKEGYVDYVLTVNFDNLMLRALALFNIFPSTYDMAILKELTTTTFKEKSIVYLHGQHHGLWLLNTPDEMNKVKTTVPRIFDAIKHKRPWIFMGYSGEDPIFEHIENLGRFDNGLYWVTYMDNNPNERVEKFISDRNKNAHIITGYDSDSFMLKLNNELGLTQPSIVDSPFSALKDMISSIVDIDNAEHFKGVKERLEISKRQVEQAIQVFEKDEVTDEIDINKQKLDLLKKEVIKTILSKEYDENTILNIIDKRSKINIKDDEFEKLISDFYFNWGNFLIELGTKTIKNKEKSELLYFEAIKKFEKAIELNSQESMCFNNWGLCLLNLANIENGEKSELLYVESIEKFKKALKINPKNALSFANWGCALLNLGIKKMKVKSNKESEQESKLLYLEAIEMLEKSVEIDSQNYTTIFNFGICLLNLAQMENNKNSEALYLKAIEMLERTIEINPQNSDSFEQLGACLSIFAKTKERVEAEALYIKAIEMLERAIEISPEKSSIFNIFGLCLSNFAKIKDDSESQKLYLQAIKNFEKAIEYGGNRYNLSCLYALLDDKEKSLFYLKESLLRKEISVDFVKEDDDWEKFKKNQHFIDLLNANYDS